MKITKLSDGVELHEDANGTKFWYRYGFLHREGGPSVEYANGSKHWHLNGKYHREDGPAIEYSYDDKNRFHHKYIDGKRWWLNDKEISKEEFERLIKLKGFW